MMFPPNVQLIESLVKKLWNREKPASIRFHEDFLSCLSMCSAQLIQAFSSGLRHGSSFLRGLDFDLCCGEVWITLCETINCRNPSPRIAEIHGDSLLNENWLLGGKDSIAVGLTPQAFWSSVKRSGFDRGNVVGRTRKCDPSVKRINLNGVTPEPYACEPKEIVTTDPPATAGGIDFMTRSVSISVRQKTQEMNRGDLCLESFWVLLPDFLVG
jgi:hypothetical protein